MKSKNRAVVKIIIAVFIMAIISIIVFNYLENYIKENFLTVIENQSHLIDDRLATPENPVLSPSGNFVLLVIATEKFNIDYNHIKIHKADKEGNAGKLIIEYDENSAVKYKVRYAWDKNDNIWVYEGNTDTVYYYKKNEDDSWKKIESSYDDKSIPEAMLNGMYN